MRWHIVLVSFGKPQSKQGVLRLLCPNLVSRLDPVLRALIKMADVSVVSFR